MSVNHVRRHTSHRHQPADLARRRTERVTALLALRDHLAATHAAYEAHGIDEALSIYQLVLEIEQSIKNFAPRIFEQRWSDWVQQDSQLQHDEQHPHERCHICTMNRTAMRQRTA